ncbi:hypothetical protein [Nesterenkonia ebinurensis]|uniref:hypothetical protein n=1 Tax=Nesterenkonia ebinurensis TaxID=2608252 RepID=UPI00123D845D|nr:hypothetical protein [Nesterenkonia ebinurensis]
MEAVEIWTLAIASAGILISGGFAWRAVYVSGQARDAAKEANETARDANTLAEREFRRTTESHAIFWNWQWSRESMTLTVTNIGLDDAHGVRLAVFKKPIKPDQKTFKAYVTASKVKAEGGEVAMHLYGLP